MIHSKAIDILKAFTKEEIKQFSDFLRSPFFNKNKSLIKLFDVLKIYHPDYKVENEKIFLKVVPGKIYNHDIMKKLMSEMNKMSDTFLSYIGIRKEKFIFKRTLFKRIRVIENSSKDYSAYNWIEFSNLEIYKHST